jgi:hypothetical protein
MVVSAIIGKDRGVTINAQRPTFPVAAKRRPIWSARSLTLFAIFATLGAGLPILVYGHQVLLVRAEWVTVIVAAMLWALLFAALMWVFRQALRQVFARGPRCRGRVGRSVSYATANTALYAGWLIAIMTIADVLRP